MLSNTNNVYLQYKENSILTASPEELVLMLYNGLVKFLLQAMKAMEDKEIEKANTAVKRAQDIVVELQASLDKKYELSKGLDLIYDYMHRRLVDANIKKDEEILKEVIELAKELRDTWSQAIKLVKRNKRAHHQAGINE
jgi:flagellar protein FliS